MRPSFERAETAHNNFDFLRFFLASCVVFTHSFNLLYGDNTDPLGVATRGAMGLGGEAVNFFFIISGFLITKSWLSRPEPGAFLRKRILRIYPAFIVVVFLCVFLVGPLGAESAAAYFGNLDYLRFLTDTPRLKLQHLPPTFTDNPMPGMVNGSLWTIRYEFLCYLAVAVLGLAAAFRHRVVVLALFLLALGLFVWRGVLAESGQQLPYLLDRLGQWPRLLSCFLAGMAFYLYRQRIPFDARLFLAALLLFFVAAFQLRLAALATPLFGAYVVLYLAFSQGLKLQGFGKYGDFSYGIYLYSFPLQQLLSLYLGEMLNGMTMFMLSLGGSVALAALSWHYVEKPCLRLKPGLPRPSRLAPELR